MKHCWGNFWTPCVMLSFDLVKSLQMAACFWYKSVWKVLNSPLMLTSFTTWKAPSDCTTRKNAVCKCLRVSHNAAFNSSLYNTLKQKYSESWTFCSFVLHTSCLQLYMWLNNYYRRTTFDQTNFGEKYASLWTVESSCCLPSSHKQEKNSCQLVCTMISSK